MSWLATLASTTDSVACSATSATSGDFTSRADAPRRDPARAVSVVSFTLLMFERELVQRLILELRVLRRLRDVGSQIERSAVAPSATPAIAEVAPREKRLVAMRRTVRGLRAERLRGEQRGEQRERESGDVHEVLRSDGRGELHNALGVPIVASARHVTRDMILIGTDCALLDRHPWSSGRGRRAGVQSPHRRRITMGYRVFTDSQGTEWQAWDVVPQLTERRESSAAYASCRCSTPIGAANPSDGSSADAGRCSRRDSTAGGCASRRAHEKRRLTPIPNDWQRCRRGAARAVSSSRPSARRVRRRRLSCSTSASHGRDTGSGV